jgi:hypothetical protein
VASRTLTSEYLESALRGLDVLLKASRFYPPDHPALKTAVEQTLLKFAPLLMGREAVVFSIYKEGFQVNDTPLSSRNLVLKNFATQLFARHVRTLLVLPELSSRDLRQFARCLAMEPQEIQQQGGAAALLQEACVSTIWVNEIDLSTVLEQKQEREATRTGLEEQQRDAEGLPAAPPQAVEFPPEEQDLEQLLLEMEQTDSDQHFRMLAKNIEPLILLNLTDSGRPLVIRALILLCRYGADRQLSLTRRQAAQETLTLLAREEMIDFLVMSLCQKGNSRESRERLLSLASCFKGKIEKSLMHHLAEETDSQSRKILGNALVRLGATASPVLIEYLRDPRWFVVRNAIGILGEIRDQQTTGQLSPMLAHEDLRVRRETVRALTKIGGRSAEGTLLAILQSEDQETRRQAILSLGALKCTAALPALLELATRRDGKGRLLDEKKEAVNALGQIGSSEALPQLKTILKRRRFWFGSRDDELRAAAALALGKIGSPDALALLHQATEDRSEQVARASRLALNRIEKTSSYAS